MSLMDTTTADGDAAIASVRRAADMTITAAAIMVIPGRDAQDPGARDPDGRLLITRRPRVAQCRPFRTLRAVAEGADPGTNTCRRR